jgi:hypothetical protein
VEAALKGILKWPLIVAAVVVVLRVVVERAGWPDSIAYVLSVVVLHTLIAPLYFAIRIARDVVPRPYATLFKLIALYVLWTRAMILPIYWLARIFEWTQARFEGLSGPGISAFRGYVGVPLVTAAIWIVASLVIGGLLGSIVVAIGRFVVGKASGAESHSGS